jgi:hypothetical protein
MMNETKNVTIPENVIEYYSRNDTIGKLDMFTLIYNRCENKFYKIAAKNSDTVVIETFDETYKYHITLTRNEPVSFVNGYYVITY